MISRWVAIRVISANEFMVMIIKGLKNSFIVPPGSFRLITIPQEEHYRVGDISQMRG